MTLRQRAASQLSRPEGAPPAAPPALSSASSSALWRGMVRDASVADSDVVNDVISQITQLTATDSATDADADVGAVDGLDDLKAEEEKTEPEPAVFEHVRTMMESFDLEFDDIEGEEGEEAPRRGTDPVQRMLDILKQHLRDEAAGLREANEQDTLKLATPRYDTEGRTRAWSNQSNRRFSSRLGAMEAKVTASLDQGVEGLRRSMHQQSQSVTPRTPRGALTVGFIKSGAMVENSDLPLSRRLADSRAATDTVEQRWRNQAGWTYQAAWRSPTLGQAARAGESPRLPRSELTRRAQSEIAGSSPLHRALASPRAAAGSPSWQEVGRALTPAGMPSPGRRDQSRGRLEGTPSRGR